MRFCVEMGISRCSVMSSQARPSRQRLKTTSQRSSIACSCGPARCLDPHGRKEAPSEDPRAEATTSGGECNGSSALPPVLAELNLPAPQQLARPQGLGHRGDKHRASDPRAPEHPQSRQKAPPLPVRCRWTPPHRTRQRGICQPSRELRLEPRRIRLFRPLSPPGAPASASARLVRSRGPSAS